MSFEEQETSFTCGIASLRYCVSLLGIGLRGQDELSEKDLRSVIKKDWWRQASEGFSEGELKRAAHRLGLAVRLRSWDNDPAACLQALKDATAAGHPCIISTHDDDNPHFHWMCVGGFSGDKAVVFDPSLFDEGRRPFRLLSRDSGTVAGLMEERRLLAWLTPTDPSDGQFFMELWPETDAFPSHFRWTRRLQSSFERHEWFSANYDEYVDETRSLFRSPGPLRASEFIDRHLERLVAGGAWWMSEAQQRAERVVRAELEAWAAVADAYSLTLAADDESRALSELSLLLGFRIAEYVYDAGRYG